MTKEIALDMLFEGDLYDAFGYVTADGYAALAALDGVALQERKTGRWMRRHSKMWECSECERGCRWRENYCPDCGAKMEVDE